ncbi:MAG TPA: hypothetical protein VKS01_03145 [Bryobacteraceae bacterium]|nr:hypothetical protein [Bryobacteraceae bacterium]
MRRALASFVLALFGFPLIAPMVLDGSAANLPACCRREGKHHCAMSVSAMSADLPAPGAAFQAIAPRCNAFPGAASTTASAPFAILRDSARIFAALVSHPSIQFQTEARYRISFDRSSQKRGPPALS